MSKRQKAAVFTSFLLLTAVSLAQSVMAQQTTAGVRTSFAVITGTAVDSIRGGYLTGAVVRVPGTERAGITDSLGHFRIDSVTAGPHQLEVIHPLLDTLGMVLKTPPMTFRAGDNGSIRLSIPSGATVVAAKCSATEREHGPAGVVGMVLEADGDAPADGAKVSLTWIDLEPIEKGFRKIARNVSATVQHDGSFRVCGLPLDLSANLVATRGLDSTSVVGVYVSPFLAVVTLFLPGSRSAVATAPQPTGVLMGRITGPDRTPIARARVAADGQDTAVVSGADGRFVLGRLKSGTRTFSVRALGYQPVERVVAISSFEPVAVDVVLDKFVPVLKTVRVAAIRDVALERVGFTERQRDQPTGRFFTPEYIEKRNARSLVHLLETAPELKRKGTPEGKDYITAAHGCLRYFVDGVRLGPITSDDLLFAPENYISAVEVGAVEIYDSMNAPGEFMAMSNTQPCTVVLIWTKFKLGL